MKKENMIELGKKLFNEGMKYTHGSDLLAVYMFALNCRENKDFNTYNTILESFKDTCCFIKEWSNDATIEIFPYGSQVTVWLMKGNTPIYEYTLDNSNRIMRHKKREEIINALDIIRASVF